MKRKQSPPFVPHPAIAVNIIHVLDHDAFIHECHVCKTGVVTWVDDEARDAEMARLMAISCEPAG